MEQKMCFPYIKSDRGVPEQYITQMYLTNGASSY